MAGVIITAIFILFFYLDEKGRKERTERAKKSKQTRYAAHQTRQRVSARKVKFQSSGDKAAVFEKFISWAKQEAKSQGKEFHRIAGENDYQKARQVFQDSEKWQQLRRTTLARYPSCLRCGTRDKLQVDHVIPMVLRPDMFNHESNLQTLCGRCNRWKGISVMDFRPQSRKPLASPQRKPPTRVESDLKLVRSGRKPVEALNRSDGLTEKQQEVRAALALSPEQRKHYEKRVAQEIIAQRRAAQARRQAKKLDRLGPRRTAVAASQCARRERVIRVNEHLETWRRANEQTVINEVMLRAPLRKYGRFDWYLCERAFREAEYQQLLTGHIRFSYLGGKKPGGSYDFGVPRKQAYSAKEG